MPHKTLQKGDSVAIVSPSANIVDDPNARALCKVGEKILTDLGLHVTYSTHWDGKHGYKSGTVAERVVDIEEVFSDPGVKAIACTQGGDNSNELLEHLNWETIKKSNALFFGLSDITVLQNALYAKTGKVSYHGLDLVWGLGMNASDFTKQNLEKFLFEGNIAYDPHPEYPKRTVIREGEASGVCLGGCLPSFALLMGTEYDPLRTLNKDFVLIIESIGESFSRIESYIAQISQQESFKQHCRGVIVGYFFLYKEDIEENNRSVSDMVFAYTKELNIPVVEIMELGHAVENVFFPIGGRISLKAKNREVVIAEYLTK